MAVLICYYTENFWNLELRDAIKNFYIDNISPIVLPHYSKDMFHKFMYLRGQKQFKAFPTEQ